ncbi:alpha/beta hydrolase domain-containing protein [Streptomyces sp. NBC_00588]|uniref:alpha/beta hydrolase domain-containing protein n=1 Tax=Streptomyces sp. NBC_00588 TaxID=2975784 RepID=UPI002E80C6FB|nr:alpha/beta hydrolase domain-containing protein [Streptomyces sp. NBC_00588]WUB41176.1 alpha/beta hydrolase domain-containing protein [Streptomyces sp. NBC_00588]
MTLHHLRELAVTDTSQPLGTSHLPDDGVGVDLRPLGYQEHEFLATGTAGEYRHVDSTLQQTGQLPYATRVLVRTPPVERFNGVVLAEPLHPEYDSASTWRIAHPWITGTGAAWVGITQDHRMVTALKEAYDPARYGELSIPAAGLRWDIVGAVLAALRTPGRSVLAGLADRVRHVYLSGWSNTGSFCRVFLQDGFHGRHRLADGAPAVDGYLIGISSGAAGAAGYPPLSNGSPVLPADDPRRVIGPADVPVFEVLSEFESETHRPALREDSDAPGDRYRLYQVAGTSHDNPLLEPVLTNHTQFRRRGHQVPERRITEQTSDARLDAVARAAYGLLHRWAATGAPPPRVERFPFATDRATGGVDELARDEHGNVRGGVRTPWVEAPLAAYHPHSTPRPGYCRPSPWAPMGTPDLVARLIGHMTPLPGAQLRALYPTRQDYLDRYEAACARLSAQGLLLEADVHMLLRAAHERPLPHLPDPSVHPLPDLSGPHSPSGPHHPPVETPAAPKKGPRS